MPSSALCRISLLCCCWLCAAAPSQELQWWQGGFDGALEAAKEAPAGTALLYFWRDGHDGCQAMFQDTLSDKACQQVLRRHVCMGIKQGEPGAEALFARFSVAAVPTVLIVQPDGAVVDAVQGVLGVKPFLAELERIASGKDTIAALRAAVARQPGDLALQLALARKLRAAGDIAGSEERIGQILAADPKFATEAAAEAMLLRVVAQAMPQAKAPRDVDLKPLKEFLARQKHKRILFLGYDRMAAVELARDDLKAAAEAAEKAWKNIPPEHVLEWGQNIAAKAYGYHEELTKPQLKTALEISAKALKAAETAAKERGDAFLANALYLHASVQIVNNLRKEAFASMERAIQLAPGDDNLKKALERWKSGSK